MTGKSFCSGCGDNVSPGTGCCNNCKSYEVPRTLIYVKNKYPAMTDKLRERIKHMYYKADLKPLRIYKITGVHPETVRNVIYKGA